ncbi:phage integrase SAM-like domain-containing protein [Solitalea canadensis]|uniref:phage integrase SAM-like domain-containing protein n=1 Tax=Solitalea canadensis TaxID=995 RepID=UPI000FC22BD4|nr:phage integrase SAM-like domain-containing protein [Solitalea canadensis]
MQVFEHHNYKMRNLINKEYSPKTHQKFVAIQNNIQEFLKYHFKKSDIALTDLKLSFLDDLDYYFKTVKNHNQNTINKTIERVKKVIKVAKVMVGFRLTHFFCIRKRNI